MPTAAEFRAELTRILRDARRKGAEYVDVNSGELHRKLGGYPGKNHAMPSCCNVMWEEKTPRDIVLHAPPKSRGASLTVRYALPR